MAKKSVRQLKLSQNLGSGNFPSNNPLKCDTERIETPSESLNFTVCCQANERVYKRPTSETVEC